MLQVWRQDDRLIPGFSRQLNAQVPRIEGDKGEFKVLCGQVFVDECVKPGNCISEGTCIANVFPRESCETRYIG